MNHPFLSALLLLALSAHGSQCSSQQSVPTAKCKEIVSEILSIQDERNHRTQELDTILDAADQGEFTKAQTSEKVRVWRDRESELHSRVNTLYNQAEANGCL